MDADTSVAPKAAPDILVESAGSIASANGMLRMWYSSCPRGGLYSCCELTLVAAGHGPRVVPGIRQLRASDQV